MDVALPLYGEHECPVHVGRGERMGAVVLSGDDLTIDGVLRVARFGAPVEVSRAALARVRAARDVVDRVLERGDVVYGLNTGLGPLARYRLAPENLEQVLVRTVVGHTAMLGDELPPETVRAMMLARANGIAKGGVGVRVEVMQALVDALNRGVQPVVSRGGSVGQADLSEMAQVAQVLIGLGQAEYGGRRLSGGEALAAAGLRPLRLQAKEALGLISANGVTVGQGSLVLADLAELLYTFDVAAALALEGFGGNLTIIHPQADRLKPHPGQRLTADHLRALLEDSYLWQAAGARNLQDPLSFRCIPQVHGSSADAYVSVRRTLEIELNAASDNPLVSLDDASIISVGNFDVTNIALAFDMLRIALAKQVQVANERIQKQLWAQFSGLPTGLGVLDEPVGGMHQLARMCASLAAEAQLLANHVSLIYHTQLAEGIEDHASMAPLGVRKTEELMRVAWRVAALEMIVAARAIDLRGRPSLGRGTHVAYQAVRARVPVDVVGWEPGVEDVVRVVADGQLAAWVTEELSGRHAVSWAPRGEPERYDGRLVADPAPPPGA